MGCILQAVRKVEDDVVRIAKTVSEHYEDEDGEVKNTFVNLALQLYVIDIYILFFTSDLWSKAGPDNFWFDDILMSFILSLRRNAAWPSNHLKSPSSLRRCSQPTR